MRSLTLTELLWSRTLLFNHKSGRKSGSKRSSTSIHLLQNRLTIKKSIHRIGTLCLDRHLYSYTIFRKIFVIVSNKVVNHSSNLQSSGNLKSLKVSSAKIQTIIHCFSRGWRMKSTSQTILKVKFRNY